jgi:hypothetical protein
VDWIKYPYRCKAVFNEGQSPPLEIQWTVAQPDAPLLGNSRIVNLCLELDKEIYQDPIGEIWEGGRRAHWEKTPVGVDGSHRCGTDEDFTQGGTYDPNPPLVQYGALGWPLCCDPPRKCYGGGGAGGYGTVSVVPPIHTYGGAGAGGSGTVAVIAIDRPTGGVEVGGRVTDLLHYVDAPSGGVEVGGELRELFLGVDTPSGGVEVGGLVVDELLNRDSPSGGVEAGGLVQDELLNRDSPSGGVEAGGLVEDELLNRDSPSGGVEVGGLVVDELLNRDSPSGGVEAGGHVADTFTPGSVTPGPTCATAASVVTGVTYPATGPTSPTAQQWWAYPVPNGTYSLTVSGFAPATNTMEAMPSAVSCSSLGPPNFVSNGSNSLTISNNLLMLVVFSATALGTPYTLILT